MSELFYELSWNSVQSCMLAMLLDIEYEFERFLGSFKMSLTFINFLCRFETIAYGKN